MDWLLASGTALQIAGIAILGWDLWQTRRAIQAFHRRGRMGFNFPGPIAMPDDPVLSQQDLMEEVYRVVRAGIGFTIQQLQREWIQPLLHTFLETVEKGLPLRGIATALIALGLTLSLASLAP